MPFGRFFHSHPSPTPAHLGEEPTQKCFMLIVLAEKDKLNVSHSTQPLATISESFRPDSAGEAKASIRNCALTTPEL